MKVRIDGLDKLLNKVDRLEDALNRGTKIGMKKSAFLLEREVELNAPVDTGQLKASISTSFTNNGYTADVESHTFYSKYVINGTKKMEPNPFMEDALENKKEEAKKILKEEIKKSINSIK